MQSRWRPALPPEGTGPSRAAAGKRPDRTSSPSTSGATSTASDERGGVESPPQPALRATTAEWLPPRAFLPPDTAPAAARVWTAWDPTQGTTPRPRNLGRVGAGHEAWDAQTALNDLTAAVAADRVYESVGALAADLRAQLAALEASPEFRPWQRLHPDFKPRLSGLLATMQGPPRRVTVLLDTGATHCFICARLAAALDLPPSGQPGPVSVLTAAPRGRAGAGGTSARAPLPGRHVSRGPVGLTDGYGRWR